MTKNKVVRSREAKFGLPKLRGAKNILKAFYNIFGAYNSSLY